MAILSIFNINRRSRVYQTDAADEKRTREHTVTITCRDVQNSKWILTSRFYITVLSSITVFWVNYEGVCSVFMF